MHAASIISAGGSFCAAGSCLSRIEYGHVCIALPPKRVAVNPSVGKSSVSESSVFSLQSSGLRCKNRAVFFCWTLLILVHAAHTF